MVVAINKERRTPAVDHSDECVHSTVSLDLIRYSKTITDIARPGLSSAVAVS